MRDTLPGTHRQFRRILDVAAASAARYGFEEVSTPVIEQTELFCRAIGAETDVVSKEMYTFPDGNKGNTVTLRPEGTAGVLRAVLGGNLAASLPQRLHYAGPMFRRERPQKGRYRQFEQFGVECIGIAHAHADVEAIALGHCILKDLGVDDAIELKINTLCDDTTRAKHRDALTDFLRERHESLSETSQHRLDAGSVLRVLDSKDPGDQACLEGAPSLLSVASDNAIKRFDVVQEGLTAVGVPYSIDHQLVRGLDYYTSTVWEFVTDRLGAQAAVLAGGRYDNLARTLGSKSSIPAVGWAAGVDRLALLMDECGVRAEGGAPDIWVIQPRHKSQEEARANMARLECMQLVHTLRASGHRTEYLHVGDFRAQMRAAAKAGAAWVMMIGEEEVVNGVVAVKQMGSGVQHSLPRTIDWADQAWVPHFDSK